MYIALSMRTVLFASFHMLKMCLASFSFLNLTQIGTIPVPKYLILTSLKIN